MTGAANLWPRFSAPTNRTDGKISTSYRAFFNRFKKRGGPAIATVLDVSPNADLARAVNEILAELRAQGWIGRELSAPGDGLAKSVQAVTMIPAATEFGYGLRQIRKTFGHFESGDPVIDGAFSLNARYEYEDYGSDPLGDNTDFKVSVANLRDEAPNCGAVSLFVTWFGDDLRATHCTCKPRVEVHVVEPEIEIYGYPNPAGDENGLPLIPHDWRVGGRDRIQAETVSVRTDLPGDPPAFGGTPSDDTLVDSIAYLRDQGFKVSFTPFMQMDIPDGNALPDPYTGAGSQPVFPWRGRVTCSPAPGVVGTPDKTAAAATQIASFVGTATPSDFFLSGGEVLYSGADEWSYRRFILHYAHLCALAGGVDVFVIGSEMRGLTWVRDSATTHPFVGALIALAADVRTILPDANIIYAADWSEYHSYQPQDGSGDLIFHLDPLWASPDIAAVGIDCYFPLADWRDGQTHLDYLAGHTSIYDFQYLKSNIFGGEGYDWFYASDADRDAQIRTPITDGAYNKPWVFRFKDLRNWWSEPHYNRLASVEQPSSTAWSPRAKPIWFTEVGCPAVNKGSNQPNVFYDPGSVESAFPYYSTGERDDTMQKRHNNAFQRFFDEADAEFVEANNPASDVYNGRMISVDRLYLYTWDARPFPAFPESLFWRDGENYPTGHWLTGRLPTQTIATQANDGMPLTEARAPADPYLINPQTGVITPRWREFLDRLGYIRGEAISTLADDASTSEIATAINSIVTTLRSQNRIG